MQRGAFLRASLVLCAPPHCCVRSMIIHLLSGSRQSCNWNSGALVCPVRKSTIAKVFTRVNPGERPSAAVLLAPEPRQLPGSWPRCMAEACALTGEHAVLLRIGRRWRRGRRQHMTGTDTNRGVSPPPSSLRRRRTHLHSHYNRKRLCPSGVCTMLRARLGYRTIALATWPQPAGPTWPPGGQAGRLQQQSPTAPPLAAHPRRASVRPCGPSRHHHHHHHHHITTTALPCDRRGPPGDRPNLQPTYLPGRPQHSVRTPTANPTPRPTWRAQDRPAAHLSAEQHRP